MKRKTVTLINGSISGSSGNTSVLLKKCGTLFQNRLKTESLILSESPDSSLVRQVLAESDGFIIGTGTYWDSWGSPLQKFLEDLSDTEGTELWIGKPVGIVVT